ncbi:MAG: TenA family transcriptional regulator [Candidatus Hodarchaeales archaeon]|jgi:pyrroloquinoline-quinone synthase
MKSLVEKIDKLIEENSLLKHPFYVQWSEGKLKLESLAGYSKEYFHLVKSVPSFVDSIIQNCSSSVKNEIINLRDDEVEHIDPWIRFAKALEIAQDEVTSYRGLEKTQQAVKKLSSLMISFEGGAAAMYALEKEIPKISETKLAGLKEFYGLTSDDAQEYFRIHMKSDIEHANAWKRILEKTPIDSEEELLKTAEKSLQVHSLILDACYETYC